MDQLQKIKTIAKAHPFGFTVALNDFTSPSYGYAVAVEATQDSHSDDGLKACIDYANSRKVHYVGGWYDSNSKKFYYDAVKVYKNKLQALKAGKKQKQLAIFDLKNKQEIRL